MERSEIERYLTPQFWKSSEISMFSAKELPLKNGLLPSGSILFQTSGSRGVKKWVIHTRKSILESAKLVTNHLAIAAADRWLLALPIHHVGGFGILARSYYSGCSVVYYPGKWNARRAVNLIAVENVTLCSYVPAQVVDIVNAELQCPTSVRAVIVGGGEINEDLKQKAIKLGWPILESYGMTETGSQIATQTKPNELSISLINGWSVRTDSEGVLEVKGDGLMKGYLLVDGVHAKVVSPFDVNGWFKTSDTVAVSSDSKNLKFIKRNDRTVKILGELVNIDTLEAHLKEVTNCDILIVALENLRRGYTLHPVVERCSLGKFDSDLLKLGGIEHLEEVRVCDSFPRNTMGKLDRVSLRELVVLSHKDA